MQLVLVIKYGVMVFSTGHLLYPAFDFLLVQNTHLRVPIDLEPSLEYSVF